MSNVSDEMEAVVKVEPPAGSISPEGDEEEDDPLSAALAGTASSSSARTDNEVSSSTDKGTGGAANEDDGDEEEEEAGEEYEVESILQERTRRGVKEFFVRWKGYGPEYDTWEPEDNLNCDEIIEEWEKNKKKPGRKRKTEEEKVTKPSPVKKSKPERKPREMKKRTAAAPASRKSQRKESSESDGEPATIVRCKTRFKKYAIEHAIKTEDDRDPDDDKCVDPLKKYFFKYDLDIAEFFVSELKVDCDEEQKLFRCGVCKKPGPVWTKNPSDVKRLCESIKNHVIGQHLGGFDCLLCEKAQMYFHTNTQRQLMYHMKSAHRRNLNMELYDRDNVEMDEDEENREGGGNGDAPEGEK